MHYPVPENDAERLKVLDTYGVVGTPPELDFDEIAEIAGLICNCPVAVVNVVADKWEWYKGKCGIPEHVNNEPRGGICSTSICSNELTIVPDLTKDSRFADQEIVKGKPHFRFYAGAPLINQDGYALGTLCVLDYQPRELSGQTTEALRCLSHQATAQLELRRRLADLERLRSDLAEEKRKSDDLLLNVLPRDIAEELKDYGRVHPVYHDSVTIMFTDFKGFTRLTERLEPRSLIEELNDHFSVFDDIMNMHGMEKLKTIGDAYMCVSGLPERKSSHALDACSAALEIRDYITGVNRARDMQGLPRWDIRIGVHSGGVIAGIVGKTKFSYDIWGDAVNVAALMEANSDVGQITISESTYNHIEKHYDAAFKTKIETAKKAGIRCYVLNGSKS